MDLMQLEHNSGAATCSFPGCMRIEWMRRTDLCASR
jgi:hypothetical protein